MENGSTGADHTGANLPHAPGGGYVLERELGRGGMAVVYLAEDRRHGRRVAVKVLHAELAAMLGTERFLQEIRLTAALQHPHILGLIDSGVFGPDAGELAGRPYYVMPYVDGESLHSRLQREGQLPVSDAIRLTGEVASALDYAHRQGVVHRDVKPENILLQDGRALVADFGIALAVSKAGGTRMTQTGLSLGTPHYMSPEQALGERTITARSDIYSLGAVTYEMLSGEPPFTGPTVQAVIARLMSDAPRPLTAQRRSVPPHVEAAVMTALEKLPADRFASSAEYARALENPTFVATGVRESHAPAWRTRALSAIPWAVALVAVVLLAVAAVRFGGSPTSPVQRFSILLPAAGAWTDQTGPTMALSPDGATLIYSGRDENNQIQMYSRRFDQLEPTLMEGVHGAFPVVSNDGRWLAVIVSSRIVRVPITGGPLEDICYVGGYAHMAWTDGGDIVFGDSAGLRRCTREGVTTLLANEAQVSYDFPHALPGERALLMVATRGAVSRLAVLDLRRQQVTELDVLGTDPRYAHGGHLLYASPEGIIRRVPFDPVRLRVTGPAVTIAEGVRVEAGTAKMALSRSGTIVTASSVASQRALELVDRAGRAQRILPQTGEYSSPRLSPDGRQIALDHGQAIWLADRTQSTLTRLSFDGGVAFRPVWTPDGRRVAYIRRSGTRNDVRITRADGGTTSDSLLTLPGLAVWHAMFTPDGRSIVARTVGGPGSRDIWLVAGETQTRVTPLLTSSANEMTPTISPDGQWMAYTTDETGRSEVYIRAFPSMGARQRLSLDGGVEPVWSPRGDEIFYRDGPNMIAAQVRAGATLEILGRTTLFTDRGYTFGDRYQDYDVTPDTRHFVMVRNLQGQSPLTVTLNLLENLGLEGAVGAKLGDAR